MFTKLVFYVLQVSCCTTHWATELQRRRSGVPTTRCMASLRTHGTGLSHVGNVPVGRLWVWSRGIFLWFNGHAYIQSQVPSTS